MHATEDGTRIRTALLRLLFAQKACGQSRCAFISAQLAAIAAIPADAPAGDLVTAALRSVLSSPPCARACPTQAHVALCLTHLYEQVRAQNASSAASLADVPVIRTTVSPNSLAMVPPANRQMRQRPGQA